MNVPVIDISKVFCIEEEAVDISQSILPRQGMLYTH